MRKKNSQTHRKIVAIDFFCGCGGVTHGMRRAGINVLAGLDNNPDVKYAYEKNNRGSVFYTIDISDTKHVIDLVKGILVNRDNKKVLFCACAPCQPFSLHNRNYKKDKRKSLLLNFINVVNKLPAEFQPSFIFVENVGHMKKRGERVLQKIMRNLKRNKYFILDPRVINAAHFGVAQNRKRLIFIAVKDKALKSLDKFRWDYFNDMYGRRTITVKRTIGRLSPIPAGHKVNKKDPLHVTRSLSSLNLKRLRQITIPGGSRDMWNPKYNLKCYKDHSGHKDVYGRMSWNMPAPTLTCRCISISNGRYGHPEQNRGISLKEAAILQSMGDYRFEQPIILTKVAEQIGNAVPPRLAEAFGKFIKELAGY